MPQRDRDAPNHLSFKNKVYRLDNLPLDIFELGVDKSGHNLLAHAILRGKSDALIQAIIKNSDERTFLQSDSKGKTPLHIAVEEGNLSAVKAMLWKDPLTHDTSSTDVDQMNPALTPAVLFKKDFSGRTACDIANSLKVLRKNKEEIHKGREPNKKEEETNNTEEDLSKKEELRKQKQEEEKRQAEQKRKEEQSKQDEQNNGQIASLLLKRASLFQKTKANPSEAETASPLPHEQLKKKLDGKIAYLIERKFNHAALALFKLSEVIYDHQQGLCYRNNEQAFTMAFKEALRAVNENQEAMSEINTQRGIKSFVNWLLSCFGLSTEITPENKNRFFMPRTDTSKLLDKLTAEFEAKSVNL